MLPPHINGSRLNLAPRAGKSGLLLIGFDLNLQDERPCQEPPYFRPSKAVGLGGTLHEPLGALVDVDDPGTAFLCFMLVAGCFVKFARDALLLAFEELQGDRVGVGHLHQLHPLLLQPRDPPTGSEQPVGLAGVIDYQCLQLAADRVGVKVVELDPLRPRLLDAHLNVRCGQIRQSASLAAQSPQAHEVVELAAVTSNTGVLQP